MLFRSRYDYPGKAVFSGLLLVPLIMPPFVGAIGIQKFFAKFGSINLFLLERNWIQEPIEWLAQDHLLWTVVILEVLHLYPIMYLNLSAALANIDPSLEDIATTLGISSLKKFKDIIWPLARPGFFAGAIIVFIWSMTDLGTPLLVGYHDAIPVRIFNMVTDMQENPVGFALVFIVIAITTACFILSKKIVKKDCYQMLGKGHSSSIVQKLNWKNSIFLYLLFSFVILLALTPHVTVLITSVSDKWFMTPWPTQFTTKYYQMIFQDELSFIGIKNSFLLATASTLFDLFLGTTIAFIVTRKLIPWPQILDALVMIPLALPGIILAFGYVITYSNTPLDPLSNPIPLLIIAYGIRRLPYMVRSASAGLQQASACLEEASQLMGASSFHTLRKITFPLLVANLIAGALLCFSYAMLDVSDSMILAMKDQFYPLTKAIYSLYLEQGTGEFIASALGIFAMIIISLCIMGAASILGKRMGELFRS